MEVRDLPPAEVERAAELLRRALERLGDVELPYLHAPRALAEPADEPTLRLISSIVREIAPRHVVEFGCGPSTELLALLGFGDGRMAVTSFEHDPWAARELLSVADPFASNYRWFAFCLCPLVARRRRGISMPVYDDGMAVPVAPYPADFILIEGPPAVLGGRAGTIYQALSYARRGSLILLRDVRPGEEAMVERWVDDLSGNLSFVPPGLLNRHLAFVVQEPLRAPFALDAPRAQEFPATAPIPRTATG